MGRKATTGVLAVGSAVMASLAIWTLLSGCLEDLKLVVAAYGCAIAYGTICILCVRHVWKLAKAEREAQGGKE